MATEIFRRVPQQERGQQRVARVLDAAADLIAEVGIENVTTNAIAARANTSVGSLYQFFPNKEAIVLALADRYDAEMAAINASTMDDGEALKLSTDELTPRLVLPLVAFFERNPAYRHVFHALAGPAGRPLADSQMKLGIRRQIEALIAARAPHVSLEDLTLHATVAMETVHALLSVADVSEPSFRERLVRETIRIISVYMAVVERPPRSAGKAAKQRRVPGASSRGSPGRRPTR